MNRRTEEQFAVYLHERLIGRLLRREDRTRFTFEKDYVSDPDRAILGLCFEENLKGTWSANVSLPPWFSNLLPEGILRDWVAEQRGIKEVREMELLAEVGHDLPGAVRVLPIDEPLQDEPTWETPNAPPRTSAGVEWRFSLAGVAMKFSMLEREDRFTAPATGEYGDWIVKLPDGRHADVPSNEYAMMKLAERVGIDVPEVRLVSRELIQDIPDQVWGQETRAYAIRRFDRTPDRRLVHVEDLAQVRGIYPADKYMGSFETVAALVHRRRDARALEEFTRRLAFNVLIGNGDAHLKNWSLIYRDPRRPTLAPAYDLVATFVYRPTGSPEDLGLRFDGSKRFERITPSTFERLERKLGSSLGLRDIATQVAEDARKHRDEVRAHMTNSIHAERVQARIAQQAERFLASED